VGALRVSEIGQCGGWEAIATGALCGSRWDGTGWWCMGQSIARAPVYHLLRGCTGGMWAYTHRAAQTRSAPLPRVPRWGSKPIF
jgi:hypothetical protein